MALPYDLNILDVVLLAVLVLFTLRGALKGFLDEVIGLAGLLFGIWVAGRYYGEVGRILARYINSEWVYVVGYVCILCAVMLGISMLSRALHSFLTLTYTDWLNHLAGAIIGALKGFVLCAIMVSLLSYFLSDMQLVRNSRMIPPIKQAIAVFISVLPPSLTEYLHNLHGF